MPSMIQSFYVKDNFVNTTIYDDSIVIPTDPILPKKLSILQAIFSGKGRANKIIDFSSVSTVKATYGSDLEDIKKYGQGGLNVIHGMQGGASAQICRLLPPDAETSTLVLSVEVKPMDGSDPKNSIPVYERLPSGKFKYVNGSKVAVPKIGGGNLTTTGVQFRLVVEAGDATDAEDKTIRTVDGLAAEKHFTEINDIPNESYFDWLKEKEEAIKLEWNEANSEKFEKMFGEQGRWFKPGDEPPPFTEEDPWPDYESHRPLTLSIEKNSPYFNCDIYGYVDMKKAEDIDYDVENAESEFADITAWKDYYEKQDLHDKWVSDEADAKTIRDDWERKNKLWLEKRAALEGKKDTSEENHTIKEDFLTAWYNNEAKYGTLDYKEIKPEDEEWTDVGEYFKRWVMSKENIKPSERVPDPNSPGKIRIAGTVPLFKIKYYSPGKCGNDFGIRLVNDYDRDDATQDGRRYQLEFYSKDVMGNDIKYGQTIYFAMNPEAEIVPGTGSYENLLTVYNNFDENGNEKEIQITPYILDNYDTLMSMISHYCDGTDEISPIDVDFINCTDKVGRPYEKFYLYEGIDGGDEPIDFNDSIVHLMGGSDGAFEIGRKFFKKGAATNIVYSDYTNNGKPRSITEVDEKYVEHMKISLLMEFFKGKIDYAIYDERMVDSDIYVDANYNFTYVKPVMLGKFRDIRPDIMVVADSGFTRDYADALRKASILYGFVNGPSAWSAATLVQAGTTLDRLIPIRVTATYDYIYGLARCYGSFGTFSVFAGYNQAKVTTIRFDWMPYKDEEDTMIGPLMKVGVIYAFKLDKQGTVAYMSEDSMYVERFSKLKSMRNGMVIGDAVRLAKKVLIKYVYDNEGATGAIRKATEELVLTIQGRYPGNIAVTPTLYRTERDKLLETSSCDLTYEFPGMTKAWTLNIHARRAAA